MQLPFLCASQASAALASLLACCAKLGWAPPPEWLAVYYTVRGWSYTRGMELLGLEVLGLAKSNV